MKNSVFPMHLRNSKATSNKLDGLPISFPDKHYVVGHKQIIALNSTL